MRCLNKVYVPVIIVFCFISFSLIIIYHIIYVFKHDFLFWKLLYYHDSQIGSWIFL